MHRPKVFRKSKDLTPEYPMHLVAFDGIERFVDGCWRYIISDFKNILRDRAAFRNYLSCNLSNNVRKRIRSNTVLIQNRVALYKQLIFYLLCARLSLLIFNILLHV